MAGDYDPLLDDPLEHEYLLCSQYRAEVNNVPNDSLAVYVSPLPNLEFNSDDAKGMYQQCQLPRTVLEDISNSAGLRRPSVQFPPDPPDNDYESSEFPGFPKDILYAPIPEKTVQALTAPISDVHSTGNIETKKRRFPIDM